MLVLGINDHCLILVLRNQPKSFAYFLLADSRVRVACAC